MPIILVAHIVPMRPDSSATRASRQLETSCSYATKYCVVRTSQPNKNARRFDIALVYRDDYPLVSCGGCYGCLVVWSLESVSTPDINDVVLVASTQPNLLGHGAVHAVMHQVRLLQRKTTYIFC